MLSFIKKYTKKGSGTRNREGEGGWRAFAGEAWGDRRARAPAHGQGPWWDLTGRSSVRPKLVKRCATSSPSSSSSSSSSSSLLRSPLCVSGSLSLLVCRLPHAASSPFPPLPPSLSVRASPPPSLPPSLLASSPPAHPRCLLLSRLPSVASSSLLSLTFSLPSLCFCCHSLA
jgi:hypothetical protein